MIATEKLPVEEGRGVFGSITEEQLDLMTLEQVRMWTLVRHQTVQSPVRGQAATEEGHMMRVALDDAVYSDLSLSGPEVDEDADNEDYSWMDDMEAAGVSPV
jgi:hypothetical protein